MYYYVPHPYLYPYYANVNTPMPMYHADMSRSYQGYQYQEEDPPEYEALLDGIKKEASSIDLYHRLANVAPNEKDQNDILHALESKQIQFNQFSNLYYSLTGKQPEYEIDNVRFENYREGLQKAYEAGLEGYEAFRQSGLSTHNPQMQHVFFHAATGERENVTRFESLNDNAIKDYGSNPYVVDIEKVTKQNNTFRTALWTGEHLQLTLMSIDVGDDIGLEVHPDHDQFIRLEAGQGLVQMGDSKSNLDFEKKAYADYAIFIPAGKWHNLTNTGNEPIKLYSIYAPPEHPYGTVHETKAIAIAAEKNHDH